MSEMDPVVGPLQERCSRHWENPDDIFPDHTDPEWALGSVLAQVEDLEPIDRLRVLEDALSQVREWHAEEKAIRDFEEIASLDNGGGQIRTDYNPLYGIRYLDRAPALLPDGVEVKAWYGVDRNAKVECEFDLKAEAEIAYDKLKDRVTGPIGLYLITDQGWTRLSGGDIVGEDTIEDKP